MSDYAAILDISVVTHNSQAWVRPFLRSLLSQSLPCRDIALWFRDNGSTDETLALLREIQREHAGTFARVEIDAGENIGFGRGHNANLARAESAWFLVTNVDLEFEADTLATLVRAAISAPADVAAWECRQKPFEHPKDYDPATGETRWCSSACVLFRTTALKAVEGYEPRLFLYGEDVELSYRLRDRGWRLRYVPQATVWHHTYEQAGQVKPLQFLGSTLANVLLRCRYGSGREVLSGFVMYLGLFAMRPRFPGQRRRLLANLWRLPWLAPQFLRTRRRSQGPFPFRLWDYERVREGAFYRHGPAPDRMPPVSVLVRTMPGRAGKLQEAIASVVAQTYRPIELVVVEDGGSTASAFMDALRAGGRFANLVYRPLEKSGRCEAGNAALAAATGELICFLDDDDLFYADHIEVLVAEWSKQPELGAVYGLAWQVRTEIISHEPWQYRNVEFSLIYRQSFSRALLWHHNYLPIQTVLFRRDLYQACGGFDPELDNLEDWNLWVRYSLHHDFLLVPKLTSLYRVPAVSGDALERQQVLDDYYAKAQAKHAALRLALSPPEILQIAQELSRELYLVALPRARLRDLVLQVPLLRRLYHPLRRLHHLLRRLRSR